MVVIDSRSKAAPNKRPLLLSGLTSTSRKTNPNWPIADPTMVSATAIAIRTRLSASLRCVSRSAGRVMPAPREWGYRLAPTR